MTALKAAAVQLEIGDGVQPSYQLDVVAEHVRMERRHGAELITLPELWPCGFFAFDAYKDVAEPIDGPLVSALAELARSEEVLLVAGSFVERASDNLYNTTLVFGPDGSLVTTYRKIHLSPFGGSREPEILTPGRDVVTFDRWGIRFGLSTCNDLRYPELYRALSDQGAEIVLVTTAWAFPRLGAWRTLMRARAIENQAIVVACNCAGSQAGATYFGSSAGIDSWGMTLGELDERPGVLRLTLDVEAVRESRRTFPALAGRRPELFEAVSSGAPTRPAQGRPG